MKPVKRDASAALAGAAITIALFGGSYAAKQLVESGASTAASSAGVLQARVHARASKGVVPFLGPFKLGMCSPQVRLMEGALRRVKPPVRTTKAAPCFGKATRRQVIAFQKRVHYKPTGVYNLATHRALVKAHGYSAVARGDLLYIAHLKVIEVERRAVLVATSHAILVGSRLPYSQGASRGYFPPWPRIPPYTDCSGFVTWVLWQAGVGAAAGYPPVGWTGSLVHFGTYVRLNGPLQVGDLLFYGGRGRPWGHVAIYIGHGRVASHGSVGVKNLPYNYRAVGEVRRYIS